MDIEENNNSGKKVKSAETKRIIKLETIKFVAFIDEKYENKIPDEKYKGKNLNFECRREKATRKIDSLKEESDEEKLIKKSLEYNNTNKYSIYKLLKYYYDKKNQEKFYETIENYKFCITKTLIINEGILVDLNKYFQIKETIEELEEIPGYKAKETDITDLRNSLVNIFTSYFYIAQYIRKITDILLDKDLTEILRVKYTNSSNNKSINEIYYEKEQKQKIFKEYKDINIKEANEFLQKIEFFFCRYFLNFEFIFFQLNQPIDYNHNLTLYYNYIIFSIYDLCLKVDELHNKIIFKKSKLLKYSSLEDFHYLIFDQYFDQELPFTNIMDELLQYLLLLLSSNVYNENLKFFMKYIHLKIKEDFIGQNSVNIFIEKLNNKNQFLKAKLDKDKIIFNGEGKISCDKIEIKFKNYPKNILSLPLYGLNWIWETKDFENFQETNFFQKKDLNYLN